MKNLERKSQIVVTDREIAIGEIFFGGAVALTSALLKEKIMSPIPFGIGITSYIIGGLTYLPYLTNSKKYSED